MFLLPNWKYTVICPTELQLAHSYTVSNGLENDL